MATNEWTLGSKVDSSECLLCFYPADLSPGSGDFGVRRSTGHGFDVNAELSI